jgi:uracil-DNA glycosylase
MSANQVKIHESWKKLIGEEFDKAYFSEIRKAILTNKQKGIAVYPPGPLIFNAFDSTAPENVSVVILGQDPYHNPGEAMGLSFSVPKGVKIPPSLRNIYKELQEDVGCTIPTHGNLSHWANQGVFLLNAILTVAQNKPSSHRDIGWQQFTDRVIQKISQHQNHIVFMLWGNFAKKKAELIDAGKHLILTSAHPSPLTGKAFFGNHHFSKANEYLTSHGKTPIDWQIRD